MAVILIEKPVWYYLRETFTANLFERLSSMLCDMIVQTREYFYTYGAVTYVRASICGVSSVLPGGCKTVHPIVSVSPSPVTKVRQDRMLGSHIRRPNTNRTE